ncbi:MAG: anti-sigma regulatory factor [Jaaginema sp. PMC 1079.18]|nr:anti-sigma regulatory factor [Jaaginema sp. PMC 1080.18]MEC4850324.1 anti-sigma regulatory factor [Jaaginema sp. PMC 1079.18]
MNLPAKFHLQVASDLTALTQVLTWFEQAYTDNIPKKEWLQCQLALAEGFTNAVRHAHRDLPSDTPIDLEVQLYPQQITIRIWDSGFPFDLEQHIANLSLKPDYQAGGGRGIALMYKIADDLTYQRTEGDRNCLTLVKTW